MNGGYGPGARTGHTGGKLSREKCVKTKVKSWILHEWGFPKSFWSDPKWKWSSFARGIRFRCQKNRFPSGKNSFEGTFRSIYHLFFCIFFGVVGYKIDSANKLGAPLEIGRVENEIWAKFEPGQAFTCKQIEANVLVCFIRSLRRRANPL